MDQNVNSRGYLFQLTWPIFVELVLQMLVSNVDQMMVARTSPTTAAGIIKCILHDENRIIPVSTLLEGEYGEYGVFCGVPAVIGRGGVQEIVRLPLTGAEEEKFHASCEVLRGFVKDL